MKIFFDYIFCKPAADPSLTNRGVYRGLQKEKPMLLEVCMVGEEVIKVKKGDIVLIEKYSGIEVEIDNDEYVVIREKDLIARIGDKNGRK